MDTKERGRVCVCVSSYQKERERRTKKKLKRSDIKLLEITGFKKVIDLLNKQRAFDRVQSEWADETSSSMTS